MKAANSCEGLFEAVYAWQEVFMHFFPSPEITEESEERALVPVAFVPEVRVTAECNNNPNLSFSGKNEIGPIPRGCSIRFEINNHDVPDMALIKWTARNEGQEAEYENDMGHPAGTGVVATDVSAYHGSHYMDVMVKSQLGMVLGFKRIPVVVSGMDCPTRNPKRKPRYPRNKKRR